MNNPLTVCGCVALLIAALGGVAWCFQVLVLGGFPAYDRAGTGTITAHGIQVYKMPRSHGGGTTTWYVPYYQIRVDGHDLRVNAAAAGAVANPDAYAFDHADGDRVPVAYASTLANSSYHDDILNRYVVGHLREFPQRSATDLDLIALLIISIGAGIGGAWMVMVGLRPEPVPPLPTAR
jgi:hypothetical protein